jgi:hypothetical protein
MEVIHFSEVHPLSKNEYLHGIRCAFRLIGNRGRHVQRHSAFTLSLAPHASAERPARFTKRQTYPEYTAVRYRTDEYDGYAHYPSRGKSFFRPRRLMPAKIA